MKRILIRSPDYIRDEIKKIAKDRRMSANQLILLILDRWISEQKKIDLLGCTKEQFKTEIKNLSDLKKEFIFLDSTSKSND